MSYTIDADKFAAALKLLKEKNVVALVFDKALNEGEYYKNDIFQKAHEILQFDTWNEDMIGSGIIYKRVMEASAAKVNINLLAFYNANFTEKAEQDIKSTERLLYDIYCGNNDEEAFANFTDYFGKRYDRTAYLFFIKDRNKYLPMKPTLFAEFLPIMGIKSKCTSSCTWENYQEFINIMKWVQEYLTKDLGREITLLEAHSFVWCAYLIEGERKKIIQNQIDELSAEKNAILKELNCN